jgi:hypothetical protein
MKTLKVVTVTLAIVLLILWNLGLTYQNWILVGEVQDLYTHQVKQDKIIISVSGGLDYHDKEINNLYKSNKEIVQVVNSIVEVLNQVAPQTERNNYASSR